MNRRRVGAGLTVVGTLCIVLVTCIPIPSQAAEAARLPWYCLVCGPLGGVDVTLNVLLFMPLGLGLGLRGVGWTRAACVALGLSLAIETLQGLVITGRDAAVSDVLTNTLGGALGAWLGTRRGWPVVSPRRAGRQLLLGALAWVSVLATTAWAVRPWIREGNYVLLWEQAVEEGPAWTGHLTRVMLDGRPRTPYETLDDRIAVRRSIIDGSATLEATGRTGTPPRGRSNIVGLADGHGAITLYLTQRHRDLSFHVLTNGSRLRLASPAVMLRNAAPADADHQIELSASTHADRLDFTAESSFGTISDTLPLHVGLGWVLLTPPSLLTGPIPAFGTMIWMAMLVLPVGVLGARWHHASPNGAHLWEAPALLLTGLVGVPTVLGAAATPTSGWMGTLIGGGVGWWVGQRALGPM